MVVLVTGASGGIGSACVRELTRHKDASIIAVSRSRDVLLRLQKECSRNDGVDIDIMVSDFSKNGFQNEIASHIKEKYGSLDLLLNNAGMLVNKPFVEINRLDFEEQMKINYKAPFFLIQSLIPLLKKAKGKSHVVNIGSMGGYQGSDKFPGLSAYSASKGSLAILTECLASEFAEDDIAFNCLALGSADTEMLRKAFPGYVSPTTAEEIARFIVHFLVNDHQYINGKILPVSGLAT